MPDGSARLQTVQPRNIIKSIYAKRYSNCFIPNRSLTIDIVNKCICIITLHTFIAKPNIKVHIRNKSQGAQVANKRGSK